MYSKQSNDDLTSKPIIKKKVILLDFDNTIETETEINGKIIYNETLIKELIEAQKKGALVIGFTSWYSFNYKMGTVGRKMVVEGLKEKGLNLDGVHTTYNFLNIVKLLKSKNQSAEDYLNSLSINERLEILNNHYINDIQKIENTNNYTYGKNDKCAQELKDIESTLEALRTVASDLKLGNYLEGDQFNSGKEEMFRAVTTLLGKEHEYIVFDDNSTVINVARALSKEGLTLYGFKVECMKEMKSLINADAAEEQFSYKEALENPAVLSEKIYRENEERIKTRIAQLAATKVKQVKLEPTPSLKNTSMMVLGGFIAAVGITAIALAFTVLLTIPPLGVGFVASAGIMGILAGFGLFGLGAYRNYNDYNKEDNLLIFSLEKN